MQHHQADLDRGFADLARQAKEMTIMYGYGHGTGGWGYGPTAIIMILFLAAVIVGIVALVRYARPTGTQGHEPVQPPPPEQPLAERFARGEIDEDEYHQRPTDLLAAGPAAGQRRP